MYIYDCRQHCAASIGPRNLSFLTPIQQIFRPFDESVELPESVHSHALEALVNVLKIKIRGNGRAEKDIR